MCVLLRGATLYVYDWAHTVFPRFLQEMEGMKYRESMQV